MKLIPEQNFIQHVSTQKYEFSMLDWFGGVFHPTFINFLWFRTFVRSNCNSNFWMCFRILNFVLITNIYCGWGKHKSMYYSSNEQDTPDMTGKAFESHLKEKDTAKRPKKRSKSSRPLQKDQIKRREGLDDISADRYVGRKNMFVGRFWQRVYETGRQINSL